MPRAGVSVYARTDRCVLVCACVREAVCGSARVGMYMYVWSFTSFTHQPMYSSSLCGRGQRGCDEDHSPLSEAEPVSEIFLVIVTLSCRGSASCLSGVFHWYRCGRVEQL